MECVFLSLSLSLFLCLLAWKVNGSHQCIFINLSAVHSLIGACPEDSNIKLQRKRWENRETNVPFEVIPSSSPRWVGARRTLCCWVTMCVWLCVKTFSWVDDNNDKLVVGYVGWRIPITFLLFNGWLGSEGRYMLFCFLSFMYRLVNVNFPFS